jgi:hypothetical protein
MDLCSSKNAKQKSKVKGNILSQIILPRWICWDCLSPRRLCDRTWQGLLVEKYSSIFFSSFIGSIIAHLSEELLFSRTRNPANLLNCKGFSISQYGQSPGFHFPASHTFFFLAFLLARCKYFLCWFSMLFSLELRRHQRVFIFLLEIGPCPIRLYCRNKTLYSE